LFAQPTHLNTHTDEYDDDNDSWANDDDLMSPAELVIPKQAATEVDAADAKFKLGSSQIDSVVAGRVGGLCVSNPNGSNGSIRDDARQQVVLTSSASGAGSQSTSQHHSGGQKDALWAQQRTTVARTSWDRAASHSTNQGPGSSGSNSSSHFARGGTNHAGRPSSNGFNGEFMCQC
jgi:hypothetical protein